MCSIWYVLVCLCVYLVVYLFTLLPYYVRVLTELLLQVGHVKGNIFNKIYEKNCCI